MHTNVIQQLKKVLLEAQVLRTLRYDHQHSIIGTVDTSPIGIRWAISKKKKMDRGMQSDLGKSIDRKTKGLSSNKARFIGYDRCH